MPYVYSHFTTGPTTLSFSLLNARYDIGSGDSPAPLTPLSGNGDFDAYGADRAPRRSQTVTIDEEYINAGRNAAIKNWKALHRTKGRLYRRDDDTGQVQWTPARLRVIPISRGIENIDEQAISLSFLLYDPVWRGTAHGSLVLLWGGGTTWGSGHAWSEPVGDVYALTTSSSTVVTLPNDGNETVTNGVFTIVVGDAAITSVHVVCVALGIDFTWTGTAAALSLLVFDTGTQRVTNAGAGAYGGYSRGVGHTVDAPIAMPVPPGGASYSITLVGGGVTVTSYLRVDYSDGYA